MLPTKICGQRLRFAPPTSETVKELRFVAQSGGQPEFAGVCRCLRGSARMREGGGEGPHRRQPDAYRSPTALLPKRRLTDYIEQRDHTK